MNGEIKTSFIPKQPAIKERPATRGDGGGLFFVVALILLIAAGLFYGGSFAYLTLLNSQISRPCPSEDPRSISGCGLRESILRVRNSIDQDLLVRFKRVDAKLKAADLLLGRHVTINNFLNSLSENTLHTVRFTSFEFKTDSVLMKGVAEGYDDIALQSEALSKDRKIKGFIFSDLNLNEVGNVVFSLSVSLSPEAISYSQYLNQLNTENI